MGNKNDSNKNKLKNEIPNNTPNYLENIKSKYILKKIFDCIYESKLLNIIRKNKALQKKLDISLNDYKDKSEIELKIEPIQNIYGKFINIENKKEKKYFHIFFNENKKETKRNYIKEKEQVHQIKIIIDYKINSFYNLFKDCDCILSIDFIRFKRNNIKSMNKMFLNCSTHKLNLHNFNTDNVNDMSGMFKGCSELTELDLSKFNTANVTYMASMFKHCTQLKELNLSNFNTSNVISMYHMFSNCKSLKELNISSFNTDKLTDFIGMFYNCPFIKELDLDVFKIKNTKDLANIYSSYEGEFEIKEVEQID